MNASVKRTLSNTFMLNLLTFAKMIIPLVTLPYLTRVLSAEAYGTVSYVKSVIAYTQLVVDFGFIISSTKDIVDAAGNRNKINEIVSSTILARLLLSIFAIAVGIILSFVVPILSGYLI